MSVSGLTTGCPNSEMEYAVHDFPNWADLSIEVSSGNDVVAIDYNAMTFRVKFLILPIFMQLFG